MNDESGACIRHEKLEHFTKGKRPIGIHRRRSEHNIKEDLDKIGWKGRDSEHLAENRIQWLAAVNNAMNSLVL
jgi:hypothetical protein